MTEDSRRQPLEQALDLLVYAPLGLASMVQDQLPGLVERGRSRFSGQVALAKTVGQLMAAQARRESGKVSSRLGETVSAMGFGGSDGSTATKARPSAVVRPPAATQASADALAIPSYDSLSASQVVARLAALSADELEAIRVYESETRARKSVLTRIAQLQSP